MIFGREVLPQERGKSLGYQGFSPGRVRRSAPAVPAWRQNRRRHQRNSPEADTRRKETRCRDTPSSAQVLGQFIRTQGSHLLCGENPVSPRFAQSGHDIHFGKVRLRLRASQGGNQGGDHLAPLADVDGLALIDPRLDAGEFIPKLPYSRCFHVIHIMSHRKKGQ